MKFIHRRKVVDGQVVDVLARLPKRSENTVQKAGFAIVAGDFTGHFIPFASRTTAAQDHVSVVHPFSS